MDGGFMRELVKKYLREFDELEKEACNEEGKFINGYDKKIDNIFTEKCECMFKELENINYVSIWPKYENVFRKLDLMYFLLDEKGFEYAKEMMENITEKNKWETEAKIRLFMMFVKRFYEVVYLLKGGLASSAFDRARGIYEIGVYIEIINNNLIAEKFLKHSNISRLDISRYLRDGEMEKRIIDEINEFDDDEFYKKNNGWAKELFQYYKKNITFKDLAFITKYKEYYYMYKIACLSTHATIIDSKQGIELEGYNRGENIWITGPSKNGIDIVLNMLLFCSTQILANILKAHKLSNMFILLCSTRFTRNKE